MIAHGTAPLSVTCHTPPDNLNVWPATFSPSGQQIQNPHIITAKVILPGDGVASISFKQPAAFTSTPQCTASYQTGFALGKFITLSLNPTPNGITIFGQSYIGVYFVCLGD